MKFTTLDGLQAWLDGLTPQYDLIAPRDVDGHVLYRPVVSSDEILFDYHQHGFPTPSGRAELYSQTLLDMGIEPFPEYEEPPESPISTPEVFKEYPVILLTGMRQIEYWHSQQRHCPTLKRRNPEPTAELHKDTAALYGIADGDPIFIETRRGRIETKAMVTESILPGITRAVIIDICRELNWPVTERFYNITELYGADEVFLTGTTTEVLPIVKVDNHTIGGGKVGPISARLLEALQERGSR